jgi:hypothetical protein
MQKENEIIYTYEQLVEALRMEKEKTIHSYGFLLFLAGVALASCIWVTVIYNQKLVHQKELLYLQEQTIKDYTESLSVQKKYLKFLKDN